MQEHPHDGNQPWLFFPLLITDSDYLISQLVHLWEEILAGGGFSSLESTSKLVRQTREMMMTNKNPRRSWNQVSISTRHRSWSQEFKTLIDKSKRLRKHLNNHYKNHWHDRRTRSLFPSKFVKKFQHPDRMAYLTRCWQALCSKKREKFTQSDFIEGIDRIYYLPKDPEYNVWYLPGSTSSGLEGC